MRIGFADDSVTPQARAEDALAVIDHIGLDHTLDRRARVGRDRRRVFATSHTDRVNGLLLLGVEDVEIPLAPLIPVLIIQGSDDDVTPPPTECGCRRPHPSARASRTSRVRVIGSP